MGKKNGLLGKVCSVGHDYAMGKQIRGIDSWHFICHNIADLLCFFLKWTLIGSLVASFVNLLVLKEVAFFHRHNFLYTAFFGDEKYDKLTTVQGDYDEN